MHAHASPCLILKRVYVCADTHPRMHVLIHVHASSRAHSLLHFHSCTHTHKHTHTSYTCTARTNQDAIEEAENWEDCKQGVKWVITACVIACLCCTCIFCAGCQVSENSMWMHACAVRAPSVQGVKWVITACECLYVMYVHFLELRVVWNVGSRRRTSWCCFKQWFEVKKQRP